MADRNSSRDTQEEKPRLNQTDLPSCLSLDVLTKELWAKSNSELYTSNVVLSCMKVPTDKGPGENRTCPSYTCMSGLTQRSCSAIDSMQTYRPIQCPKTGQAGGATGGRKLQLESLKLWAKSDKDFRDIDFCCPPEVLENMTNMDIKKVLANEKQQLSAMDPQEANLDHQTPKTPRDHRTSRRKIRSSRERRDSGNPTPMLGHPTPTHIPLCLDTSLDHLPRIGQQSSQGWVFATGVLGFLVFLVFLVFLGMRLWRGRRGRRKERCSSKEAIRMEKRLRKGEDGDGGAPLM